MRKRRGREEGAIFERTDGRWVAEISLGYDGGGGRIRKTVYGKTKGAVAEKLRTLQAAHDAGKLVDAEVLTVREYLNRWLTNTATNKVEPTTLVRYKQLVERYLIPTLGGMKLHKLQPLHIEQCYAAIKTGTDKRKPAGATTQKDAGVILSAALKHAVLIKLIPHNPASDVVKARPAVREMMFMSPGNARQFLGSAKGQGLRPLFVVAVGTGARQGELLGLQWSDIDIEKGTLDVKRSLAWVNKEPFLKEPKTKSGRRTILLPKFAVEALREHRQAALKAGLITAPVFCTRTGKHLDKKNVLRSFRNVVKKANAATAKASPDAEMIPEGIRFHDLRHTHASHLIGSGYSIKAVSRRLGHAGIEITLRTYAHLLPNDDEKLAAGVELLFG